MLESGASESNRDTLPALILNTLCVKGLHGTYGREGSLERLLSGSLLLPEEV